MKNRLRYWLPVAVCALLVAYTALYKVGNTDFWWHIKAGQILRDIGWIHTDPFSYVRAGQPYLAHHEWLAQVFLSIVFDYTGVIGITLLRMFIMLTVFALPVLLHRRHLWLSSVLAVIAATGARPAFTDRPQLFSFLFFSLTICLCIAYLESSEKVRRRILWYLPVATVLWSNLHGAASLTGIAIFGTLFVQRLVSGAWKTTEWKRLALCAVALLIAPIVSPSGFGNLKYAVRLFNDQTTQFIAEWQPATWGIYVQHTLALWLSAILALAFTRRNVVFSTLVLLSMGYLSRSAVRHEVLFLISALALTVYQLRHNEWWNVHVDALFQARRVYPIAMSVLLLALAGYTHVRAYDVNRVDHLFGVGLHEPMKGAYEYIEQAGLTGPIFNSYNAGGELLYRGYPERKVFIDGRNIDYGYVFMSRVIIAGQDAPTWYDVEEEYGFTHAAVYYDVQADQDPLPYTDLLDADPNWKLVYLDDWAALYVKDAPEISPIALITPKMLHDQIMPKALSNAQFNALQAELNHMIQVRPDGIKPRLYLARLYMLLGAYEPAQELLEQAAEIQSNNYLVYVGLAQLHIEQNNWPQALFYLKKAERKAGFTGVQMNQQLMQTVEANTRS